MYFSAEGGLHGRELWVSDGSASGTVMVKDLSAGAWSSLPASLVRAGAQVYFTALGLDGTRQLWRTPVTP